MRWRSGRQSNNVEDYRGSNRSGGGRGGFRIGLIGTAAIVLIGWYMGANPLQLIGLVGGANTLLGGIGGSETTSTTPQGGALSDDGGKFVSVVLGTTEDVWNHCFNKWASVTKSRSWRYLRGKLIQLAASRRQPPGHFTAPATTRFTLI